MCCQPGAISALDRLDVLETAMRALLVKWDAVLPHIQGAEGMAYVHGWRYSGPEDGMKPEIDEAKRLLGYENRGG